MVGGVHQRQRGPLRAKACGGFFPSMRRAVVADPEHAARGPIWLGGHHLRDEPIDRRDRRLRFAPAKQFRAMDIPRGQVGQRARPEILVFDTHRTSRAWRECRMLATARLETRFLIGRDDAIRRGPAGSLPRLRIEVQDAAGSSPQTADREEKSSCDAARAAMRPHSSQAPERDTTSIDGHGPR